MFENYLPQDGIACHDFEDAAAIMQILIKNDNCVMLSREEDLWIINWVWSGHDADRNDVIFADRATYECDWYNFCNRHPEINWEMDDED